jgi:large subunit ribosomal protein L29
MLKAKDLRERSLEDLRELQKTLAGDAFQARFKNFTNRLDDTSSIRKARKDLARILTVLNERARGTAAAAAAAAPEAPKVSAPKAKGSAPKVTAKSAGDETAAAKPAAEKAAKKTTSKKTAKKSEAE